jgi:hypothetical protein
MDTVGLTEVFDCYFTEVSAVDVFSDVLAGFGSAVRWYVVDYRFCSQVNHVATLV